MTKHRDYIPDTIKAAALKQAIKVMHGACDLGEDYELIEINMEECMKTPMLVNDSFDFLLEDRKTKVKITLRVGFPKVDKFTIKIV